MEPQAPLELRPPIAAYLRRFVHRRRNVTAIRACASALLVAMLWLLAWSVVDRFFAAPGYVRLAMLLTLIAVIVAMVKMPVIALFRRRIDWRQAAEQLEDRDPRFNEMLVTIVSQSLSEAPSRASTELMARLIEAAESRISVSDSRMAVPLGPAIAAVVLCVCGIALLAGLCAWPWLGLPQLLLRQLQPLASIPPVTTTRIMVQPGSIDLIQGTTMAITAKAEPLLGGTVLLKTSTDGQSWTNIGMAPGSYGTFNYKVQSPTRDFDYQVTAGDAVSGPFHVRVLRRPIVTEFRIRLIYPAYIDRNALGLTNTDGAIEAPAGTQAEVTVIASEPLKSAKAIVDGARIEMAASGDPKARKALIDITKDAHWSLEMISEQGVAGIARGGMVIHSIPDRPPIARLMLPQGIALQQPRDLPRIPYQAADDYALATLTAHVAVDGANTLEIPLKLGADPRRCDDLFSLDLAQCRVTIGQVVTLTLVAIDRFGQTTTSAPARILISPHAIDPYERRRLDDLRDAMQLAKRIADDLDGINRDLTDTPLATSKLASAAESGALLVRTLLRASVGIHDRQRAATMAMLADVAQVQASRLDGMNVQAGLDPMRMQTAIVQSLHESAAKLAAAVSELWYGLSADVILLQLENVAALQNRADPVFSQLSREINAALIELGLSEAGPNNEAALRQRSQIAAKLMDAASPIDFAGVANQWAAAAQPHVEFLSQRLSTAAQLEAVRRDADLVWARDLQLASRAAKGIDQSIRSLEQIALNLNIRSEYPRTLSAMSLEHDLRLRSGQSTTAPADTATSSEEIHSAAAASRRQMLKWAGESESGSAPDLADAAAEQAGVMEANALVAQKQYDQAQTLDGQLYRNAPQTRAEIEAQLKRVRELDALDQQQAILNEQSFHVEDENLAAKQAEVNRRIRALQQSDRNLPPEIDSRERGLAAIRRLQGELADFPQRLARIDQLAAEVREARDTVQRAANEAGVAPEQIRTPVLEELEASKANLEQTLQTFKATGQSLRQDSVSRLNLALRDFTPETKSVMDGIERNLIPAMQRLNDQIAGGDASGAPRGTAELRRSLMSMQEGLRTARQALLERDPLVAARWFAQEAAGFLADGAANQALMTDAQRAQTEANTALRRAWDDSVHRLAEARLAGSKAMGPLLRAYQADLATELVSPGADWSSFRRWREEDPITSSGDAVPPGYQDALRAYFKVLDSRRRKGQ